MLYYLSLLKTDVSFLNIFGYITPKAVHRRWVEY